MAMSAEDLARLLANANNGNYFDEAGNPINVVEILQEVYDSVNKVIKCAVDLNVADIQIGAVEIKDAVNANRVVVNADGSITVKLSDGTHTLDINADGSFTVKLSDGTHVLDINADGSINSKVTDGTHTLDINADGSITVLTKALSSGTLVDAEKSLIWGASVAQYTRQNMSLTVPVGVLKELLFSFVNMSRTSDMTVEICNVETIQSVARAIILKTISVPKAVGTLLDDGEDTWDSAQGANVTCSADAVVYKVGTKSAKIAIGVDATAGLVATEAVTSANLSDKTHIAMWVYSGTALDAGDLRLVLDDTASCASPLANNYLPLPAIPATTWTKVFLPMTDPTPNTAIICIGIDMVVDKGAFDLYIDDVYAIKQGSNGVRLDTVKAGTCQVGVINDTAHTATDYASLYMKVGEI